MNIMILFFSFIFGFFKYNEKRICGELIFLIDLIIDEINIKMKRINIWELKVLFFENVNYNIFKFII